MRNWPVLATLIFLPPVKNRVYGISVDPIILVEQFVEVILASRFNRLISVVVDPVNRAELATPGRFAAAEHGIVVEKLDILQAKGHSLVLADIEPVGAAGDTRPPTGVNLVLRFIQRHYRSVRANE